MYLLMCVEIDVPSFFSQIRSARYGGTRFVRFAAEQFRLLQAFRLHVFLGHFSEAFEVSRLDDIPWRLTALWLNVLNGSNCLCSSMQSFSCYVWQCHYSLIGLILHQRAHHDSMPTQHIYWTFMHTIHGECSASSDGSGHDLVIFFWGGS